MIDTHSHIYLDEFNEDRNQVIQRAKIAGVEAIFMPNIDLASVEPMLNLVHQHPGYCFPMMGLHPTSVKDDYETVLSSIMDWFNRFQFSAIGEIGIDLYWDKTYRTQQIVVFEEQLKKAKALKLPVVIHCRDAFKEVFASVEKHLDHQLRGVFHSFSGTPKEVSRIVEYGTFMIGINGIVTFKNSSISESAKFIPLDRLVVETDSPFLAPVPHRGRRNEPAYVAEVIHHLARLHQMNSSRMEQITTDNANQLFQNLPN